MQSRLSLGNSVAGALDLPSLTFAGDLPVMLWCGNLKLASCEFVARVLMQFRMKFTGALAG